jgi:predicted amidophosphoribosyltransferase
LDDKSAKEVRMICPACGARQLDGANFCPACGAGLGAFVPQGSRWEYKDLTIALHMDYFALREEGSAERRRADALVATHLQSARRDGWQAAEPTDLPALLANGRMRRRQSDWRFNDVASVCVRLQRPLR